MKNVNRLDDGRRSMPKRICPVCSKRAIDCSDLEAYYGCELTDYRIARQNETKYDYVIICPNPKCHDGICVTGTDGYDSTTDLSLRRRTAFRIEESDRIHISEIRSPVYRHK